MRVLLVKPPFNQYNFVQHFMVCEPLEFEVLASKLAPHHDVRIIDLRVDRKRDVEHHVRSFEPDVVGFTALTMDVNTVVALASSIKRCDPRIVTCVGGEHASHRPHDFDHPDVDYVFRYDAVSTFDELLRELENKAQHLAPHNVQLDRGRHSQIRENPRVNDDLSALPLPRRDLCERYLPRYAYGAATPVSLIQFTAGCAFRCTYCSIPARQLTYMKRTTERILEDIASTKTTDLLSIDANALQDVAWCHEVYGEIARADLKKRLMISCRTDTIVKHPNLVPMLRQAGVSVIAFGVESLDDRTLHAYNKHNTAANNRAAIRIVQEHDILVRANFIIDQQFTEEQFARLADDIKTARIEFPTFQILTPLPGTKFYDEVADTILTDNFDLFDLSHSVLPTDLPFDEFHAHFQRLFRSLYGPRRFAWLATRLPIASTLKSVYMTLRSHASFSYRGHLDAIANSRTPTGSTRGAVTTSTSRLEDVDNG